VIAALINLTTLILVGLYLVYEALWRLFNPEAIEGWIVVVIAGVALCIDLITAFLTFSSSKNSVNIKAAFLHNVSDAMASLGVMLAGSLVLLFQWYWVDTLVTLVIAGVVLWQGASTMPVVMQLLMDGTPEHVSVPSLVESMTSIDGVEHVYHVHVWQIDEHRSALEAHVQIRKERLGHQEDIKSELRELLKELHSIEHSTLEIEVLT
jgi:cobalt-zinc-cadmium efflux system protein